MTVESLKMQVVLCWKVQTPSKEETHRLLGARTETWSSLSPTTRNQDTTATKSSANLWNTRKRSGDMTTKHFSDTSQLCCKYYRQRLCGQFYPSCYSSSLFYHWSPKWNYYKNALINNHTKNYVFHSARTYFRSIWIILSSAPGFFIQKFQKSLTQPQSCTS